MAAGRRARARTGIAARRGRYLDPGLAAAIGVFEADLHVVAQITAALRPAPALAPSGATDEVTEHLIEDVGEAGAEVESTGPGAAGSAALEGGVAVAFHRQIAAAPDPEAFRRELEEKLVGQRRPYARGEAFGVNDLIDPRQTRPVLCDWVDRIQLALREQTGPRSYTYRP